MKRDAGDASAVAVTTAALVLPVATNSSNFNGTAIAAGRYLWFTSAMKVTGMDSTPVHLHISQAHVEFTAGGINYDIPVPDSRVTIDPTAASSSTAFDTATGAWETTIKHPFSGNAFMGALAYQVPHDLPGGINPVTWSSIFEADKTGLTVKWVWGAAVYTNFSLDYNALLVKPIDANTGSPYLNSDHAGTPEAYKDYVVGGARGGGGSNYTGSLSGTVDVTPTYCASVSAADTTCDGVDDNCNAVADESYAAQSTTCGVGACTRGGSTSCVDGVVQNSCVPGTPAADDASCNGIDSDCDAVADENYATSPTSCGVGECAASGSLVCASGAVADTCTPGTPAPADMSCDARDDNCNASIDEGYVPQVTSCGVGECARAGVTSCVGGAVYDSCMAGTPAPDDLTCDAVDEDCNGVADDGYVSLPTSCGVGACAATGATSCVSGQVHDSCAPGTPAMTDTVCDAVDEDCDSLMDEDYAPVPTSCGSGPCVRSGETVCALGMLGDTCTVTCEGACADGLDDDGDALVDCADDDCKHTLDCVDVGDPCATDGDCEGLGAGTYCDTSIAGGYCTLPCGEEPSTCPADTVCADTMCVIPCDAEHACDDPAMDCVEQGESEYCRPSCPDTDCLDGYYCDDAAGDCHPCVASDTTCDGLDNDCDGVEDDDYAAVATTCGVGACAATGATSCLAGHAQDSCTAGTPAPDATCDSIDDDCDGSTDEAYVSYGASCGVGACAASAATACVAGEEVAFCVPGTPAPSDPTCDATDDDCDGVLDENFIGTETPCGLGTCATTGQTHCALGIVVDGCTPLLPESPVDTVCDHRDPDCDGVSGEDYVPVCYLGGLTRCEDGLVQVTPCDDDDVCNGLEACADAQCYVAEPAPQLPDADPCTIDTCDADLGPVHTAAVVGAPCDDATVCSTASQCIYGCQPPVQGLVSWWPAEGDATDRVGDNDAQLINFAGYSAGISGLAFDLTGTGQYVDFGNRSTLHVGSGNFTVAMWVLGGGIFGTLTSTPTGLEGWSVHKNWINRWEAQFCGASAGGCFTFAADVGGGGAHSGNVHLAFVADTNTISFYRDGQLEASTPRRGWLDVPAGPLVAGTDSLNVAATIGDKVDDILFYNRALSGAELAQVVAQTPGCAETGVQCRATETTAVDDGDPCTADSCDPETGVAHVSLVDDNNACTTDRCDPVLGALHTPVATDDGNACTTDACDHVSGAVAHTARPAGAACDDGNACTLATTCDAGGACAGGTQVQTDDGDACTTDACDPATGAVTHAPFPTGTSCSDGNACNGEETCAGACEAALTGLRHYWPADSDFMDSIDGAHGTPVGGADRVAGRFGQAFRFDGVDDHVDIAPTAAMNIGSAFTVEMWINADPVQGSEFMPLNKEGAWGLDGYPNGTIEFPVATTTGTLLPHSVTNFKDGHWHHLAGVIGGGQARLYVDGNLESTVGYSGTPLSNANGLVMGQRYYGALPFRGMLDQVSMYDRALSASEIGAIFNAAAARCDPRSTSLCQPGTPPIPDDGNPCTDIVCDAFGNPVNAPVPAGTTCSDGNSCTTADTCDIGGTCSGQPIPGRDDGNACTTDTCDPSTGAITHVPASAGTSCSDGDVCNGSETCGTATAPTTFVRVNPVGSFLRRSCGDRPLAPRILALSEFGLHPGDPIALRAQGAYVNPITIQSAELIGVFSSTTSLLGTQDLNRVPGALQSDASSHATPPTSGTGCGANNSVSTDIARDFRISTTDTTVIIPAGAAFLLVGSDDSNSWDNYDPEGDYGFTIRSAVTPAIGCQPGTPLVLDDDNACTTDHCDPVTGVAHDAFPEGARSCADPALECGPASDGCGNTIDCGACAAPDVCGEQAPNRCGAPALLVTPSIHVSRHVNVALYENGAGVIEPADTGTSAIHDQFDSAYFLSGAPGPKAVTLRLMGTRPHVVDRVTFTFGTLGPGIDRAEVWATDQEPFAAENLVKIAEATSVPHAGPFDLRFAPTRARYVRLVINEPGSSVNPRRIVDFLAVHSRAREGGITSLAEGGAEIVSATSSQATRAIDLDTGTAWEGPAPQTLVVQLAPGGEWVDQVELGGAGQGISAFAVDVSDTGYASGDFVNAVTGTLANLLGQYTFEFPPMRARYARLRVLSGGGQVPNFRVWSQAFGGAAVPFDDLTPLPASQVASRLWDFGDDTTSTEAHPLHTYAAPGSYEITLTVTDTSGRVGIAHTTYRVLEQPHAEFIWAPTPVREADGYGTYGQYYLYDVSTYPPGQTGVTRAWHSSGQPFRLISFGAPQFGDDVSTPEPYVEYVPRQDGSFATTLTVSDTRLITGSFTLPIPVENVPPTISSAGSDIVSVWGEPTRLGTPLPVIGDQGAFDSSALSCRWDFGDGFGQDIPNCSTPAGQGSPTDRTGTHTYADPGVYTATFTVFDDDTSTSDTILVTQSKRFTSVVPLGLSETATDGDFVARARLSDTLDAVPLAGFELRFVHDGVEIARAVTAADGTAEAVIHFTQLSFTDVEIVFDGDARHFPASQELHYLVREGDTAPVDVHSPRSGHEGIRFVLGFPQAIWNPTTGPSKVSLLLTARAATEALVSIPGLGFSSSVSVVPGKETEVELPDAVRMAPTGGGYNQGKSGYLEDKGIEVTSADPITVYGFDFNLQASGSYLALPADQLGQEYFVLAYQNEKAARQDIFNNAGTQMAVVAAEDNTQVTITPATDVAAGPALPAGARKGVPFTVTLDALQTFQITNAIGPHEIFEDFTGSQVTATKPVAVYGGHVCATMDSTCEHLVTQLPPISAWGGHFIVAGTDQVQHGLERVRVLASQDGTELRRNGQLLAVLKRGAFHQVNLGTREAIELEASAPVLVAQYSTDTVSEGGDPEVTLVPPIDQYVNEYAIAQATVNLGAFIGSQWSEVGFPGVGIGSQGVITGDFEYWLRNALSIVAPASEVGGVRVDGQPVSTAWFVVGNSGFAVARVPAQVGFHRVRHVDPNVKLGVRLYGDQGDDSYGYIAGLALAPRSCEPSEPMPGDHVDNDCDGLQDEERLDGEDDDGDGVKDEDLAAQVLQGPNRPPVAYGSVWSAYGAGHGGGVTERFALSGLDPDGDPLTWELVGGPVGVGSISGGTLSVTAAGTFSVRARDAESASAPVTVTIQGGFDSTACETVRPEGVGQRCNTNPYFFHGNAVSETIFVPSGVIVQYARKVSVHDNDFDPVTYSLTQAPPGMTIDATGTVRWNVTTLEAGVYSVTVRAVDQWGAASTYGYQLTVTTSANRPPTITSTPPTQAHAGEPYAYQITATDPEGSTPSYTLVAGPATMTVSATGALSWVPTQNDTGTHSVVVRVADPSGAGQAQSWSIEVLGGLLRITSSPQLTAFVGQEYDYLPVLQDDAGGTGPYLWGIEGEPPAGLGIETGVVTQIGAVVGGTGHIRWTPTREQAGQTYVMTLEVTDQFGHTGRQFFSLTVEEFSVAPRIVSDPVTSIPVLGMYLYDVDAADAGEREYLTYTLQEGPPEMVMDEVSGVLQWIPEVEGSYPVRVRVTDSTGLTDEQAFVVEVVPDTTPPVLTVTASPQRAAPMQPIVLTVSGTDDVLVMDFALTVDDIPLVLDEQNQAVFESDVAGVHVVRATARDPAGNVGEKVILVGITDASDTEVPLVALTAPLEDAELTYVHDVIGTVADTNLFEYRVEVALLGESSEAREIASGHTPIVGATLGQLDTTLLENGYWELRVTAEDVNGLTTQVVRPFRVDGQAKVGVVQLSFVDMAVPMAGIPITVVRNYDSRVKRREDFGFGWTLDVKHGSVQHNRAPGDGFLITTRFGEFQFPCAAVIEERSHFTEVRLSARERYIFRPVIANTQTVSGHCEGQVFYELVEGTLAGAQLHILGGLGEYTVASPALPIVVNPEDYPPQLLTYGLDPERGVFNPREFRLELADGRKFDVRVGDGIFRIEDRNQNALLIGQGGVTHSNGTGLVFERDLQNRIKTVTDAQGRRVAYGYDLNGDLVKVTNQIDQVTQYVYERTVPHHLDKIINPDREVVAAMDYDTGGRLTEVCDAEGGCAESAYDLNLRTVTQTDATSKAVAYTYDARGNVTSQTDGLGNTVTFTYDAEDNLTRAEGPDGSIATYTYDANRNLLTRVLPHEADESAADFTYAYTYNARNDRETVTLPSGGVIQYTYDASGNLTATRDGAGNVIESRTYNADGTVATRSDRFGTMHYDAYSATGQPTLMRDIFNEPITLAYDASGNLLSRSERGEISTFEYDALGRRTFADYGASATAAAAAGAEPPICAGDRDCDGLLDAADNCPGVANAGQEDSDVPTWTATGAAAVWKFEEPSGTTALDSTGSYNCILTDASLRTASGRVGRAIRLNGYPDNCGSALNIDQGGSTSVTFELWVNPSSTTTGRHALISTENGGFDWSIMRDGATWYVFTGEDSRSTGFSVDVNQWQHLAAVFIPGTGVQFYKNGVAVLVPFIGTDTSDSTVLVGRAASLGESFDGVVDEVAVYERALSAAEIQTHAQMGYSDGLGDACDPCPTVGAVNCVPTGCTDADGDGYGILGASACTAGHAEQVDCDDSDATKHPNAVEACDGIDNDCDGARDQGCVAVYCLGDQDCDGVADASDNCPTVSNTSQTNTDATQQAAITPLAVWSFEEPSGTTLHDTVGGHDAQMVGGATRSTGGRFGQALQLDGTGEMRVTALPVGSLFGSSFTLTFYTQSPGGARPTFGFIGGGGDLRQNPLSSLTLDGVGRINVGDTANTQALPGLPGASPAPNWTHMALSCDGANYRQYINGVLTQTTPVQYLPLSSSNRQFVMGESGVQGQEQYFNGKFDEVAVYGRALTGAEIAQVADNGPTLGDTAGDACDACPLNGNAACVPTSCTDADGDGYGPQGASACTGGAQNFDCDETDAAVHSGAAEVCDGLDNNCDGRSDEGCPARVTVRYTYGDVGDPRWTAIEGPTMGRVERHFSSSGRLSSWVEPNGDEFTRLYDAAGRVEEEVGALGNRTVYGYDAAGRLQGITDVALGATTTFVRDSAGRVTKTTDALGHETHTSYKLGGRLKDTTNARGFTTAFDRDPTSSAITDALTRTTVTSLTAFGLPTSTTYPGGASTSSAYAGTTRLDASQSFPTGFNDELLRARSFGYDPNSGLTSTTDLAGKQWQYTYAASKGSAISYDVFSGDTGLRHHQGGAQAYSGGGGGTEYRDVGTVGGGGGDGAFVHHLDSVTSPMGETTRFVRGDNGRIERVEYPDGGVKRISYGADAQPDTVVLPQGTALSFAHDAALRETSRVSSLGETRSFTYGPNDRIETMTDQTGTFPGGPGPCAGDGDCDGVPDLEDNCPLVANASQLDSDLVLPSATGEWRFEEPAGTTVLDSVGATDGTLQGGTSRVAGRFGNALSFDGTDDYVQLEHSASLDIGSAFSVEMFIKADPIQAGLFSLIDKSHRGATPGVEPFWSGWTVTGIDDGRVSFGLGSTAGTFPSVTSQRNVKDGQWHHVAGVFDGSQLRVYVDGIQEGTAPMVGAPNNNTLRAAFGRWETGANHFGQPRYFHGLLDEVALYPRALSAAEITEHASVGLPQRDGDACDACPDNADPACVPTSCTDADGDGYGPQGASACTAGQPTRFDCDDTDAGVRPGASEVCNGHDDNCDGVTDEQCPAYAGTTDYQYDASGRFTGIVYPHGGSVMYTRDKLDRVTAVRVKATATASEVTTSYSYDANGNLETVTDPLGGVTTMVYDSVDRLTEKHLPNGVVSTYGYDERDRVLSVVHTGPSGVLASVTYERSASGEPTKITREDGSYVDLTYDAALRLDTETYRNSAGSVLDAIDYNYDDDGNRISKNSLSGGFESYGYSAGFKLNTVTKSTGTDSFTYDGGGRVTGITRDGSTETLEYNSDDKITRVTNGSTDIRYTFDGVGRRVAKVEGGATTRYLVAPNLGDGFESPQAVTDASGNVVATFVYAGEQPIAKITPSGVEYFLQDAMGSVIGKANGSGGLSAAIKYDGFGNVTSAVGAGAGIDPATGSEPRFQGMALDAGTGLYFVRARTYDSKTGRFTTRDPVAGVRGRPESMNPYVLDYNNPYVWSDPNGQMGVAALVGIGIAVGIVLALVAVEAGTWALRAIMGRALTPNERKTVNDVFCSSPGTCGIDASQIRVVEIDLFGEDPKAWRNTIFVPSWVTDNGGLSTHRYLFIHEVTHVWQNQQGYSPYGRLGEIITGKLSYELSDIVFSDDSQQSREDTVLRFLDASIEAQGDAVAECSEFYVEHPRQCDAILAYVRSPTPPAIMIIE